MRRQKTRQRTPYQTLLLDHIESILDMEAIAKDKFIISCLDETGSISLDKFCCQKDLLFLRASVPDVSAALSSSLWLCHYYTASPIPKLKLPCEVYQKSLVIYDLPNTTFHKAINKYTEMIMKGAVYEIKRCKEGLLINFSNKEDLFCFWKALDISLINGVALKAMVLVKKTPQQYRHMIRSQSVVFSQYKPHRIDKIQKNKKEPLVIEIKDNNFPALK